MNWWIAVLPAVMLVVAVGMCVVQAAEIRRLQAVIVSLLKKRHDEVRRFDGLTGK